LNNHYNQLTQIELAYQEQDAAESDLNIRLEEYKTDLSELAPHGIISTDDLRDMIELLKQDCNGKTLLLSLIFSVSQNTTNKTDWSLTDTFPMTLLVSVKNFFEQKGDSNEEGTTDYGKYKMYMFRVLFLRYRKWSDDVKQTLNATQNQLPCVFQNDKAPSCVYENISLHRLEKIDETQFGNLCMNDVYAFVNERNESDNLIQSEQGRIHTSVSFSPSTDNGRQSLRHPPTNEQIEYKTIQDIKDKYYTSINKVETEYTAVISIWNTIVPNAVTLSKEVKDLLEPTVKSFIETYEIFKQNINVLQHEVSPFKKTYYSLFDKYSMETVFTELSELKFIGNRISDYIKTLSLPLTGQNPILSTRTSDQAARTLLKLLDGDQHWPSRKIAYAMKALQNAALVSTPEPQVLTALTSQQKTKYMENFKNGRVIYAIIGVTNIDVKEEDGETYEVNLGPMAHKAFVWLANSSKDDQYTRDSFKMLNDKFTQIKAAFASYEPSKNEEPTQNINVLCMTNAINIIEFFTGKTPGKKAVSTYSEPIANINATETTNNTRSRSTSKRVRRS
jgi:hypothetical protein